jgi:predicted  nucleic acid-binding Zn-ribbon protein
MGEAIDEIGRKIAAAQAELDATLKERAALERSIAEANQVLAESGQTLHAVLVREGTLRGVLGDLNKASEALKRDA